MVRGAIQLRTKVNTKQEAIKTLKLRCSFDNHQCFLMFFSPQSFFLGKVVISMAKHDFTQVSFALVSPRLSQIKEYRRY